MMLARCPACRTVFRVRPEQLRAHHGGVRCGRCEAAFNALEHLLDETPRATPRAARAPELAPDRMTAAPPPRRPDDDFFVLEEKHPASPPPGRPLHFGAADSGAAGAPATRSVNEPSDGIGSSDRDPTFDRLDFEIPESLPGPRRAMRTSDLLRREPLIEPTTEPRAKEPSPPDAPAFPEFIDVPDLSPGEALAEPSPEHVPFAEWARRTSGEPGLAIDPSSPAAGVERSPDAAATQEPEPAETASNADDAAAIGHDELAAADEVESPAAVDDAREAERLDELYGPPPATAARRWVVGLSVGILLGALAVQAAYLFREQITRAVPPLRPAYLAACEILRCTVPVPRIVELIGIETSDLQADPRRADQFILHATVRNRAPHPQAYPHLELTLTDARDRPVVRRVLAPAEWVPPQQIDRAPIPDGFPAGTEVALRLPFEAAGVRAVGYRLYVFYP